MSEVIFLQKFFLRIYLYIFLFISFRAESQEITFISRTNLGYDTLKVQYDTSLNHNRTESYSGEFGGWFELPLDIPSTNLYPNSSYSRFIRAGDIFDVHSYPARTTVKLGSCKVNETDKSYNSCTGTIVGAQFVLTSAHCVAGFDTEGPNEGFGRIASSGGAISITPDNGFCHTQIPSVRVAKTYVLSEYLDPKNYNGTRYPSGLAENDFALLQLDAPIGMKAGWLGIGYHEDSTYFSNKIFHKFAIPGGSSEFPTPNPLNNLLLYNGDTLYYNYGLVENSDTQLIINGFIDDGTLGQSGSSLFYTNNNDIHTIYGTQTFYQGMKGPKIREDVFYGFKYIMEKNAPYDIFKDKEYSLKSWPNPVEKTLRININQPQYGKTILSVYSMKGEIMYRKELPEMYRTMEIDLSGIYPGLYILHISNDHFQHTQKIIKR